MHVTVVGSVGLDTVETPAGRNTEGLGGAAVYFSLAAVQFAPVEMVGVVGEDFPEAHTQLLASRGIGLEGLETAPGRTFRWTARYHDDVNERDTLDTQLNVFADFHPVLPDAARKADLLFLGNIHPSLQIEVLDQAQHQFVALDTMNLWIDTTPEDLAAVLGRVDALTINDAEAKQLTGELNLPVAAKRIQAMGPKILIIKKGEHGCMLFGPAGEVFAVPAFPLEEVVDPTGAGDSFAGGFMGYLARESRRDFEALRLAVVYGSVVASFTCEAFGPDGLTALDAKRLEERVQAFRDLTCF